MIVNQELKYSELIEAILATNILIKENWLVIKKQFNAIYPDFFIAYLKKGIQLSTTEERYLLLDKIGMNTQNIADLLQVQPESVYTMRYRLRKKLNNNIE